MTGRVSVSGRREQKEENELVVEDLVEEMHFEILESVCTSNQSREGKKSMR